MMITPMDVRLLRPEGAGLVSYRGGRGVLAFSYEGTTYVHRAVLRWPLRVFLPVVLDHERAHARLEAEGVPWEWHHAAIKALR